MNTTTKRRISLFSWRPAAWQRFFLLMGCLLLVNLVGWVINWSMRGCTVAQRGYAGILGGFVTVLVGSPLIAFLCIGWYARFHEFENSLKDKALSAYLQRYWSKRLIDELNGSYGDSDASNGNGWRERADSSPELCDRLFTRIYHEQYGLLAFVLPYLILLSVAYAAATVLARNYTFGPCNGINASTCVYGITQQILVASFGGALMFIVSDSVLSIRRRALNVSDVYWYALRIMLAIPLALVAGGMDGKSVVIVFALATFPIDALMKVVRRMGFPQVTQAETDLSAPDKLLSLSGVTLPIVAVFEAEGVNSIEQVGAADPVVLSIRTGFPFRFTLRLCSQAIVQRHLGNDVDKLIPVGLADVLPIYFIAKTLNNEWEPKFPKVDDVDEIIKNAAARLLPKDDETQRIAIIKMKFRQIAAEEFTVMLARITPLDPGL
ncbi:hypothetical protein [Trinickia dabaoshanensis]|nr:hypothetical protein [Trinickia dabaoshanensis]